MDYQALLQAFRHRYPGTPRVFRAPGRINLIGEHTDYNDGWVLPAAINREIGVVLAPNGSDAIRLYSQDLEETLDTTLAAYAAVQTPWARYVLGVVDQLRQQGHALGGFDAVIAGNIPQGAGLSSSAALECATLTALNGVFGLQLDRTTVATLAQRAENEFVGVNCGIMDQYASVFGQADQAICIDCRALTYQAFPISLQGHQLLLVDSKVTHSLKDSEYNTRRAECEAGVAVLQRYHPAVRALRDVSPELLDAHGEELPELVYRRCKYIVEENQRVGQACEALQEGNWVRLGQLLYQTHHGLQHEFEISCPELDFLVDYTRALPHVLGSRMMGGGFGGCSINLVKASEVAAFSEAISTAYAREYGHAPEIYPVTTASGASEITQTVVHHV